MKKQLMTLGTLLVLALGALPSLAASSYFGNYYGTNINPCCPAPVAVPCCPAAPVAAPCCPVRVAPCCPTRVVPCCPAAPVVKPCCPAPVIAPCPAPCPAAPVYETHTNPSD